MLFFPSIFVISPTCLIFFVLVFFTAMQGGCYLGIQNWSFGEGELLFVGCTSGEWRKPAQRVLGNKPEIPETLRVCLKVSATGGNNAPPARSGALFLYFFFFGVDSSWAVGRTSPSWGKGFTTSRGGHRRCHLPCAGTAGGHRQGCRPTWMRTRFGPRPARPCTS